MSVLLHSPHLLDDDFFFFFFWATNSIFGYSTWFTGMPSTKPRQEEDSQKHSGSELSSLFRALKIGARA